MPNSIAASFLTCTLLAAGCNTREIGRVQSPQARTQAPTQADDVYGAIIPFQTDDGLAARVDDITTSVGDLASTVAADGETLAAHQGAVESLTAVVTGLQDKITALEAFAAQAALTQAALELKDGELLALTSRVTELEHQVAKHDAGLQAQSQATVLLAATDAAAQAWMQAKEPAFASMVTKVELASQDQKTAVLSESVEAKIAVLESAVAAPPAIDEQRVKTLIAAELVPVETSVIALQDDIKEIQTVIVKTAAGVSGVAADKVFFAYDTATSLALSADGSSLNPSLVAVSQAELDAVSTRVTTLDMALHGELADGIAAAKAFTEKQIKPVYQVVSALYYKIEAAFVLIDNVWHVRADNVVFVDAQDAPLGYLSDDGASLNKDLIIGDLRYADLTTAVSLYEVAFNLNEVSKYLITTNTNLTFPLLEEFPVMNVQLDLTK